jgi:hypothetical protein
VNGVVFGVLFLGLGATALVLLFAGASGPAHLFFDLGLVFTILGVRVIRPALSWVRVSDEALDIYNCPYPYTFLWSDVLGVENRRAGQVAIRPRSGRPVRLLGLSGSPVSSRPSWRSATVADIQRRSVAVDAS